MCAAGVSFVYRKEGSRAQEAMACALGGKKDFNKSIVYAYHTHKLKKEKKKARKPENGCRRQGKKSSWEK